MGKGSSSSVATPVQEPVVTPAVARSIAADTESAQMLQAQDSERMRGISNTYRRYNSYHLWGVSPQGEVGEL